MAAKIVFLVAVVILAVLKVKGDHFVVGNVANRVQLAKNEKLEYNAFPFMKRIKYYFYSGPDYKKIQGIQALDTLHTKSSINITSGGLGHSFVNLRMKSERGTAMAYDIAIYVNQDFQ